MYVCVRARILWKPLTAKYRYLIQFSEGETR
jgi:hypothetical protein